jgi:prepilin-type N-terminal cleavage/methylation domain-containing protein
VNRGGFTLIEVLTVTVIMGLLASMALPKYQLFRKKAEAADAMAAMVTARGAAYNFNESHGVWPATAGFGVAPKGLDEFLPGAFSFDRGSYQLAWTSLGAAIGRSGKSFQLLWLQTEDGILCQSVAGLWGGQNNAEIMPFCSAKGGFVVLFVDR